MASENGQVKMLSMDTIDEAIDAAGICMVKKNDKTGLLAQRCDLWLLDLDLTVCYGKRTRKGCTIHLRLEESYGKSGEYHLTHSPIQDRKKLKYWLKTISKKPSNDEAVELLRQTLRELLEAICKYGLYLKLVYYGDAMDDEGNQDVYGEHEWHLGKHKAIEFSRTVCRAHLIAGEEELNRIALERGWVCIQN